MSRQYSLKTFLRQVRGSLLNKCLHRHGITTIDLNMEVIKPSVVDEMHRLLMMLPSEQFKPLELDFMAITELASRDGTEAILREASNARLDLTTVFKLGHSRNDFERACWTFLKHPQVFDRAVCFQQMDQIGARRWHRRFVGTGLRPDTTLDGLARLRAFLCQSFAREGRGQHCHIDHYIRRDPDRHCFFAYPEDHPTADLTYNERGELHQRAWRTAFEVIFVYRPAEGILEVMAPGGQKRVEDLAACFCTSVLGMAEYSPRILRHSFELSVLKAPGLSLPTDPQDRIAAVLIRELCLTLPRRQGWRRRLLLNSDRHSNPNADLHDMIVAQVEADGLTIDEVRVSSVKFCFIFEPENERKGRRLPFTVGTDHCTLKDGPHDHIARKYLRRWGIDPDGQSKKIPA